MYQFRLGLAVGKVLCSLIHNRAVPMLHRRGKTLEKGWTLVGDNTMMRPEKTYRVPRSDHVQKSRRQVS